MVDVTKTIVENTRLDSSGFPKKYIQRILGRLWVAQVLAFSWY